MLSPADGRISAILHLDEHEATDGPVVVVRIFLSVLNVHVNRAPCSAEVLSVRHEPGRFFDARTEESASLNEFTLTRLRTESGDTLGVRQVAGKVARRIVCAMRPGQRVRRGERVGMIRFGSTAELIRPRPEAVEVHVREGQNVRGGLTVLATLAPAGAQPAAGSG
jgi:phosphatidylserine decarboxylase